MINGIFSGLLIIILIYAYFAVVKDLRKNYYQKVPPASILFFRALIFPKDYFKKDNLLEGYLLHVFSLLIILTAVYLFGKLGGLV